MVVVDVTKGCRAINCIPGKLPSAVTSARFDLKASPPSFEPATGEFYGGWRGFDSMSDPRMQDTVW
eukprot:759724-Hanusia_phi.AAC.7